jgi:hypothetical protein
MNPPTEQLVRDYLNRVSVAAKGRLGAEDRRAFLARTREFIEQNTRALGQTDAADVMKLLAGLGDPAVLVDRERDRLAGRRAEPGTGDPAGGSRPARAWRWRPARGTLANLMTSPATAVPPGQDVSVPEPAEDAPMTGEIRFQTRPISARWRPGGTLGPKPPRPRRAGIPRRLQRGDPQPDNEQQPGAASEQPAGAAADQPAAGSSPLLPADAAGRPRRPQWPSLGASGLEAEDLVRPDVPFPGGEPEPFGTEAPPRGVAASGPQLNGSRPETAPPRSAESSSAPPGSAESDSAQQNGAQPGTAPGSAAQSNGTQPSSAAEPTGATGETGARSTGAEPNGAQSTGVQPTGPESNGAGPNGPPASWVKPSGKHHSAGRPSGTWPNVAEGNRPDVGKTPGPGVPPGAGEPAGPPPSGPVSAGAPSGAETPAPGPLTGVPPTRAAAAGASTAGAPPAVVPPAVVPPAGASPTGALPPAAALPSDLLPTNPRDRESHDGDLPPGEPPAGELQVDGALPGRKARLPGSLPRVVRGTGWASGVRARGVRAAGRGSGWASGVRSRSAWVGQPDGTGPARRPAGAPGEEPLGSPSLGLGLPPGALATIGGGARRLARTVAVRARRRPLEATAIVLLGLGGLIFPPVWLMGAAMALVSRVWDHRDKWIGLALPLVLVVAATVTDVLLGASYHSVGGYVREAWLFAGHFCRIIAVLGAIYLAWRAERGRRSPAIPPWNKPRRFG